MRIVALISGGKDSIYNILQCVSSGHDIVALANIYPETDLQKDDLDSFMFQTVGHEGITLIAEAIGLPLYRQATKGKAHCSDLKYKPVQSDEIEDLFELLAHVKKVENCEGVAVGAIASEYQRIRVENVCSRLGLTSLAYLWQQDQASLLKEMIKADVNAVVIKVASMGLVPSKHLGLSISELEPIVTDLNKKYGVNICGEGGEYETFVLDCPIFHKKIILDKTQIFQDADSGYLSIISAHLENKFSSAAPEETLQSRLQDIRQTVPSFTHYLQEYLENIYTEDYFSKSDHFHDLEAYHDNQTVKKTGDWLYVSQISDDNVEKAIEKAKGFLKNADMSLSNLVFASLWLNNMDDFAAVNSSYVKLLRDVCPARACVAITSDEPILLDLIACQQDVEEMETVHVQSVSHWAPANIGPYCQNFKVGGLSFVAGQIPLIPGSMSLLEAPIANQVMLALRHIDRILKAGNSRLSHVVQITAFISQSHNVSPVLQILQTLPHAVVACVVVNTLPRKADVELLAVAATPPFIRDVYVEEFEDVAYQIEITKSDAYVAFICHVKRKSNEINPDSITKILTSIYSYFKFALFLRIFYKLNVDKLDETLKTVLSGRNVTRIPVLDLDTPDHIITFSGMGNLLEKN